MKCPHLLCGKNKKKILNLSAESAQRVLKVNFLTIISPREVLEEFCQNLARTFLSNCVYKYKIILATDLRKP